MALRLNEEDHLNQKRRAMEIAAVLPSDKTEAIEVLRYAEQLVCGFLSEPVPQAGGNVVQFPGIIRRVELQRKRIFDVLMAFIVGVLVPAPIDIVSLCAVIWRAFS